MEDLNAAILEFEATLPGWWWSIGKCSVSFDASCGPDRNGPDAALLKHRRFDEGFHIEGMVSVSESLRFVMQQAVTAKSAAAMNEVAPTT